MRIYIPCHTQSSMDGYVSGDTSLGVGFLSQEEAEAYLKAHPPMIKQYGDGERVISIEVSSEDIVGALIRSDNENGANLICTKE